jgi:hypothetical protein
MGNYHNFFMIGNYHNFSFLMVMATGKIGDASAYAGHLEAPAHGFGSTVKYRY